VSLRVSGLFNRHGNGKRPLFVFVNDMTPHTPYMLTQTGETAASRYVSSERIQMLDGFDETWIEFADYLCGGNRLSRQDVEALRAIYLGQLETVDESFGTIWNALRDTGMDDKTLIIFTSDHGEEFGEHGLLSHHYCVYDTLLRVPFILRCPWKEDTCRGEERKDIWALVALPKLVCHLMGIPWNQPDRSKETAGQYFRHHYFLNLVESHFPEAALRNELDERMIWRIQGGKKYIFGSRNGLQIYDLSTDPGETNNMALQKAFEEGEKTVPFTEKDKAWFTREIERSDVRVQPAALKALKDLGYL